MASVTKAEKRQAVKAMRQYLWIICRSASTAANQKQADKLRRKVEKLSDKIAVKSGYSKQAVWVGLTEAAKKAGVSCPLPGKDY